MEENDVNAYTVSWVTSYGLTQDDYVSVFDTGITNVNGYTLYDAYIQPSTLNPQLIGQAWIPSQSLYAFAQSESENIWVQAACPTIARYEYFGTNGAGGGGNSEIYELQIGVGDGGAQAWDIANHVNHTSHPPYTLTPIYSASALKGYGS